MQNFSEKKETGIGSQATDSRWSYDETMDGLTDKSKLPYFLILFLISPVLAAFSAIFSYKQHGAKLTLVLFFGVYGYTLIIRPGADSYTLAEDFVSHYPNLSFPGFLNEMASILSLQGSAVTVDEPYMSILGFTVSRFSSDPSVLFLFAGLVFGAFFIKGVSLVYAESRDQWNLALAVLFIFFFSWVFLDGVNAPRTHTANWVFFTGAFLYLKTNDIKYIFLVMLAPFIHFGYLVIITPFFVYLFFKDFKLVYISVLVVSYFASTSLTVLEPYLMATELGESKLQAYTGSERWDPELQGQNSGNLSFHARYYRLAADYAIQFMLFISLIYSGYLGRKYHDRIQNGLGTIAILLLSFANFATIIPVLRNRLMMSFGLFALAYLVRLYTKNWEELRNRHWIIYICIPFILLFLFTKYSIIGDYLDFRVLFSPLSYPFIGDDPVSMKEFIRQILDV